PRAKASQVTQPPIALPQTESVLFVPSTGPEIEGITPCGNNRPNVLFLVARLNCARESTRGRYAVRARSIPAAAAFTCSCETDTAGLFLKALSTAWPTLIGVPGVCCACPIEFVNNISPITIVPLSY